MKLGWIIVVATNVLLSVVVLLLFLRIDILKNSPRWKGHSTMKAGDQVIVHCESSEIKYSYDGPGIILRQIPHDDPTWETFFSSHPTTSLFEVGILYGQVGIFEESELELSKEDFSLTPCDCEDWEKNLPILNSFISYGRVSVMGEYTGKQFLFCPWCGKQRTL